MKHIRKLSFRADRYDLYFLCYQEDCLVAGISFQYPAWIQKRINGDFAAMHLVPGLSLFSWDAEEIIEFYRHD